MDELITWLLAQVNDDERTTIRNTVGMSGGPPGNTTLTCIIPTERCPWTTDVTGLERSQQDILATEHSQTHADPFRLAEIKAKRLIIHAYEAAQEALQPMPADHPALWLRTGRRDGLAEAVRLLGQSYAGREGYRQEWRPAT